MTQCDGDTPIMVRGGAAGTQAVTEDLTTASAVLDAVAGHVDDCHRYLEQAFQQIEEQQHKAEPEVLPWLQRANRYLASARWGGGFASFLVSDITATARDQSAVARHYDDAERQVEAQMGALGAFGPLRRAQRAAGDVWGLHVWASRAWGSLQWTFTPPGLIGVVTGKDPIGDKIRPERGPALTGIVNQQMVGGLLGTLDRSQDRHTQRAHMSTFQALATAGGVVMHALERAASEPRVAGVVATPAQSPVNASETVGDVVERLGDTAHEAHGGITIDTVTAPDGSEAYIVNIPGTSDNTLSDLNPADWANNFAGAAGDINTPVESVTDYAAVAIAAMREHGIPADAPVMLVGHSQGSHAAYSIAAFEGVRSEFHITHVVGVAGPTGDIPRVPGIQYIEITDESDPIPGTDGDASRPAANETVVRTDVRSSSDPHLAARAENPLGAHSLETYEQAAREVDALQAPSVEAFVASASAFTDGTVSSTLYMPEAAAPSVQDGGGVPGATTSSP
ncbi:hypothetical protein [Demequina sediminicola]|uniref:hypothetical protein n=1 Tax=Demequina sediminicola TaxID=1095026 RepID=UPI000784887A|nr:hypothetical protein [Demequina sediminicola]